MNAMLCFANSQCVVCLSTSYFLNSFYGVLKLFCQEQENHEIITILPAMHIFSGPCISHNLLSVK